MDVENIHNAVDMKNYKERIFKVPLFMDEDDHILYAPLSSFKAIKPFIVLGFTPQKRFSEGSPSKSKGVTQIVNPKEIRESVPEKTGT